MQDFDIRELATSRESMECNVCGGEMVERFYSAHGSYWLCPRCIVRVHEGEEPQDYPPLHDMIIGLGG